jgi:hypothetical protein
MNVFESGSNRIKRTLMLAGLLGTMVVGTGCTQVLDTILAAQEGSDVTIQLGALNLETSFTGGIDSTVEITISLFDILFGRPLDGTVEINDLLLAGTPIIIPIGPGISTGAICVSPLDPGNPGGGTIVIDLKRRKLTMHVATAAGIRLADPVLGPAVGVLEFPVAVDATVPVSLADLLGALGGGSLPLDITQEVSMTINDPGSPFNGAVITGQFVFAQEDTFPSDPLLTQCRALVSGP